MRFFPNFLVILTLCLSTRLLAQEYRVDSSSPAYAHEWNWQTGPNRTIRSGSCGGSRSLVSRWRVKERNEGDFWHSMVNCREMNTDGTLDTNESFRRDHFEYSGNGSYFFSRANEQKVPVGVKLKYKTVLGVKKIIDFTLIELPISKVTRCDVGTTDAGWATGRNSSNHQVVKMLCSCGVLMDVDIIERKPNLSGYEISGVKTTCRLVKKL